MVRTRVATIGLLVVAGFLTACDTIRIEERRGAFWEPFMIEGPAIDEVSHFESLAEMLAAADAVVVARVTDVAVSRIWQGERPGERWPYVRVQLRIDRVISGHAPGIVQLEFLAGGAEQQVPVFVESQKGKLPADSVVVFLHAKGGAGEAGLYRVINSTGLWAPTTRASLDAPLRMEPPPKSGLYAAEIAGIREMNGLVDLLVELAD
jgi:hypothetical protein